jgi:hypothetical protein
MGGSNALPASVQLKKRDGAAVASHDQLLSAICALSGGAG